MKNKSWIIILIMGIALTISLAYSIIISKKANDVQSSHTVTTTSIIEMTATTATIKNTLTGTGKIEYKELEEEQEQENDLTQNIIEQEESEENENTNSESQISSDKEIEKVYQIALNISQKDLDKVEEGQNVEIAIKKENQTLNYIGKIKLIEQKENNQSTIIAVIDNPDETIEEGLEAICTIIIEQAVNVVALPIEAIQKRDEETFVQQVVEDGTTKEVIIETGISDDYYVEITKGLEVGDRVQIVKSTTTVTNENKTK